MRTVFAAAAIAMGAMAAVPAQAAVHDITYTGKVGYGFDLTGMFGAIGTLNEERYSLVYTIDDMALGALHTDAPDLARISGSGANSPVRAAITVKGVTRQINGSYTGYAEQHDQDHGNTGGYDYVEQKALEYEITPTFYHSFYARTWISANSQDFLPYPAFGAPYTYNPLLGGAGGYYDLVELNDQILGPNGNTLVNYAYMNLTIDGVTVSTRGAGGGGSVPEPGAWALLIMGFGGAGAMLRHRRREMSAAG